MNKFLLGLLLGTLLGFTFAELVRNRTVEPAAAPAADQNAQLTANGEPGNTPVAGDASADTPGSRTSSQSSSQIGAVSSSPPTSAMPSTATAQATDPSSPTATTAQASANTPPASAPSTRTPIAVPEAIKSFFEKTDTHDGLTLGQMHTKLEDEAEDLAWAYQMEIYLRQSFMRPTKSGQPLDIRVIECRTSMCEIVGFSTHPNPTDDISAIVQYMSQQPWWDFDNFNMSAEGADNGGKFLTFLRRKR